MQTLRIYGTGLALMMLTGFLGCANGKSSSEPKPQQPGGHVHNEPTEHTHGPHDGHLAEFGEDHKMEAEVTYSADPREIRIYIVDHEDTGKAIAIKATKVEFEVHGENDAHIEVPIKADPQEGETDGAASQFVVETKDVPESIKGLHDIKGEFIATIDGKEVKADFGSGHDDD